MNIVLKATSIFMLLCTSPALAHAFLHSAVPAVGSTVHASPAEVSIVFTEGVEPAFSHIKVTNTAGMDQQTGPEHAGDDNRSLVVSLKPLTPGRYIVAWKAVSIDTHKTQGSYSFTVAP